MGRLTIRPIAGKLRTADPKTSSTPDTPPEPEPTSEAMLKVVLKHLQEEKRATRPRHRRQRQARQRRNFQRPRKTRLLDTASESSVLLDRPFFYIFLGLAIVSGLFLLGSMHRRMGRMELLLKQLLQR